MESETVALREHVDQRFADLTRLIDQRFLDSDKAVNAALASAEKAVGAALSAADRAVAKAETAAERRFEAVNEFRAALSDQAERLMPRIEAETRLQAMAAQITGLSSRLDRNEGRGSGMHQGWLYLLGGLSLVATLLGIYAAFAK